MQVFEYENCVIITVAYGNIAIGFSQDRILFDSAFVHSFIFKPRLMPLPEVATYTIIPPLKSLLNWAIFFR